jgi:2-formylbenzoate dehydrogenase
MALALGAPADELGAWIAGHDWRMLSGGRLVAATDDARYETVSPGTGATLAAVPAADAEAIGAVGRAAAAAAPAWAALGVRERARIVRGLADVLLEHEEELAVLDAVDGGNPVTAMRSDVRLAADMLRFFADGALELRGETVPGAPGLLHYTVREPFGVVARIVAYNHPIMFAAGRIAAPLVAGNAVIVKAPDQAPLSALRLGEIIGPLLPPGVLGIVSGHGPVAGDALVRHPDVRRIGFIGSVRTGRAIQRAAAESGVKSVTLELGGKNALIVCEDADPAEAAAAAVRGMNFHWTGGQSCGSTSRLLVHDALHDEVVERVLAEIPGIRIGSPLDPATEMGPMISEAHRERVLGAIRDARAEGARVAAGGGPPEAPGLGAGSYVAPTVLVDVTPDMRVAGEEVFGPVLSVIRVRDDEEALRIANATPYGLTAAVWTRDLRRAHTLAHRLEAGYVWVNTVSAHFWGTPFGGVKDSGVGREEGLDELVAYTQSKTVSVRVD